MGSGERWIIKNEMHVKKLFYGYKSVEWGVDYENQGRWGRTVIEIHERLLLIIKSYRLMVCSRYRLPQQIDFSLASHRFTRRTEYHLHCLGFAFRHLSTFQSPWLPERVSDTDWSLNVKLFMAVLLAGWVCGRSDTSAFSDCCIDFSGHSFAV